ncbi:MAG TPA: Na+/H+ antiporter subunit E [Burkholderiaceae bacterium]|nr:Na+/H+ antiporter subunit E [Burkholderiaceae bacterium]
MSETSEVRLRGGSALAALFLFWLAMSGYFTAFLLSAGLACALAVTLFARRMGVVDDEGFPLQLGWRVLVYWLWLFKEIVKSAWTVSRIILDPRLPISPTLVTIRPSQRSAVGLVVHANSITLTPGTITLEADAQSFVVHALTQDGAQGMMDPQMDRRVSSCEHGGGHP